MLILTCEVAVTSKDDSLFPGSHKTTLMRLLLIVIVTVGSLPTVAIARPIRNLSDPPSQATSAQPAYCIAEHNVGRMVLAVTNTGSYGSLLYRSFGGENSCFTGDRVMSCEFPKGSQSQYLAGTALWVGAVVGRDTLVSTGPDWWPTRTLEFHPDQSPFGDMILRSTVDPARPEFEDALSEQDYICTYYDTCMNCIGVSNDALDNRPHRPLNIEVTQRSFAWSYSYAQDFVLVDYSIRNIGQERLRRIYMGVYVDVDVYVPPVTAGGQLDDVCGFRRTQPAHYLRELCPVDSDEVNLAWAADNDGDLEGLPVPNTTSTRIVRTPSDSLEVSFNWWLTAYNDPALDFGPQARKSYRDFSTGGLGSPVGDRNKYHVLRNGEHDYDQVRTATIGPLDSVWLPPSAEWAGSWAMGVGDVQYLLSFGPFEIDPGQSLPITLAYVGGINFHSDPGNIQNLPNDPDSWYEGVNFDSLGVSATWADWVYDNPGVDTDSDGYAGEFTVCNLGDDSALVCDTIFDTTADPDTTCVICRWEYELADTVWRKGDGVPDFRGASPPPSPAAYSIVDEHGNRRRGLRVESSMGRVRLLWNGVRSETTRDVFSREIDFEGYRVWIARDERRSSYSVAASYDIEDYNRWDYNQARSRFILKESPFSLEELRCMYGDSCGDTTWHPDFYPRSQPLVVPGEPGQDDLACYFEPQDHNRSVLANDPINATTPIKKVYPDAPRPPVLEPDSIRVLFPNGEDTLYLTEEGFIKYYEYEYTFENLLPTVPYWINVTAFDYGSPKSGLAALETNPTLLPVVTYPHPSVSEIAEENAGVYVYPNPYRLDDDYRFEGFEGRDRHDLPEERTREIHFANLPANCTIRIYTLDGDIVREITHGVDPADPLANHDSWDMITRNSQQPVSGLYYWTVEDERGHTQIDKLVIIM